MERLTNRRAYPKTAEYYTNWAEELRIIAFGMQGGDFRKKKLEGAAKGYDYLAELLTRLEREANERRA